MISANQQNDRFRTHARAWLIENFPSALTGHPGSATTDEVPSLSPDQLAWRAAMGRKGWGTPTWPSDLGGGGLNAEQAAIVREEMERLGAYNPVGGMGVMMFGPTLLEFGSDAQKLQHIPPIVRGETWWCQGFSEPGAGSDLASLQCKADDMGDHWLVNGQKVWTSGAQHADWCFCLVRTDTSRKQGGISFVVFDMRSPGVVVKPIRLISGSSPFCEMFLNDVRVPKENLVGPLNGGWNIAKRLLQHERTSISNLKGVGTAPAGLSLPEIAKRHIGVDESGRLADADLRARIIRNDLASRAFQLTSARSAAQAAHDGAVSATSSILKNAGTQTAQVRAELLLEILGVGGLGWANDTFAPDELAATQDWLAGKASTIYGGSQEVQNNIISKQILSLPTV